MERIQSWVAVPPRTSDGIVEAWRVEPISGDRQPNGEVPPELKAPVRSNPPQAQESEDLLAEVTALLDRLRVTGELRPVDLEYMQLVRATRHYQMISELTKFD